MTDLTYCYLHMTDLELHMLDYMDMEAFDYYLGDLSDEGPSVPLCTMCPKISAYDHNQTSGFQSIWSRPIRMNQTVGPNFYFVWDLLVTNLKPGALPSQMHISYPYGDPTKLTHPASRPHRGFNKDSRALYEDMGFGGAGVNAGLEWKELALELLLPVDPEKEEAARAELARRLASGANQNQAPVQDDNPGGQPQQPEQADTPASVSDAGDEDEDADNDDEEEGDDDEGEQDEIDDSSGLLDESV